MMHKRFWLIAGSTLALLAAPASLAAQEAPGAIVIESLPETDDPGDPLDMAGLAALMGAATKPEPLTPEQQARLPQAEAIINRIMPPGAMADMSQQMFSGFMGGFGGMIPSGARGAVADALGLVPDELAHLSDAEAAELANLFDPAWEKRGTVIERLVTEMMSDMMNVVEPGMRRAMAELYAIRFTSTELAAIDSFFATEAGAKYARESISMASDPRLMAASMEAMPAMFASIGATETKMKEGMAGLPEPRRFANLSAKERARVAKLTGLSIEDLIRADEEVMTMPASPLAVPPQTD